MNILPDNEESGSHHPPVPSILSIFQNASSNLKNKGMQRKANSLQWRQKYQKASTYEITLVDKRCFTFNQIDNGEIKGIGTGAVVWPAAHVLAMYLEVVTVAEIETFCLLLSLLCTT